MKCVNCGKNFKGQFCPNCGAPAPEKPASGKKKFRWWYILVALLALVVLWKLVGDDSPKTADPADGGNDSAEIEPVETPANAKEAAESYDLMIYTTLEMAERYLGVLQEDLNGLTDGSATMLDVYNTCENVKQYMSQFDDHLDEVPDEAAAAYKEAVHGYIILLWGAADSLMEYIDNQEMSDLSDAQESVEALTPQVYLAVAERMAYLSNAGFTDEEIQAILEESAEE